MNLFHIRRLWFHTYSYMISTITLCSSRHRLNPIVSNPWIYEWSIIHNSHSHSRLWELQHEVLPVKHNHITEPVSLIWCYYVLLVVLILSRSAFSTRDHHQCSPPLSSKVFNLLSTAHLQSSVHCSPTIFCLLPTYMNHPYTHLNHRIHIVYHTVYRIVYSIVYRIAYRIVYLIVNSYCVWPAYYILYHEIIICPWNTNI
jgi:hypothetical protein